VSKVVYSMGVSLDGFIAGPDGEIDWGGPDEELHRFHNEQMRQVGAHLCGRGLYETMLYWETAEENQSAPEYELEFARLWKQVPKTVFSRTLENAEGDWRLADGELADEVIALKEQSVGDIGVGGAGLASELIKLDLIDEYRLFLYPVVLGGGTPYFPPLQERIELQLGETRPFGAGVTYLRYERADEVTKR
jgi:dihydrofolate reductase